MRLTCGFSKVFTENYATRVKWLWVHNAYLLDYPLWDLKSCWWKAQGAEDTATLLWSWQKDGCFPKMSSLLSLTHLFALIFSMLRGSEMICCCRYKLILNLFLYATGYLVDSKWNMIFAILRMLLSRVTYSTASACIISMTGPRERTSDNILIELCRVWTDKATHVEGW